MTNRKVYTCANCGHRSGVKSNFKGTSEGKFYCNSDKRPHCNDARQYEVDYNKPVKPFNHNFNPIDWR